MHHGTMSRERRIRGMRWHYGRNWKRFREPHPVWPPDLEDLTIRELRMMKTACTAILSATR